MKFTYISINPRVSVPYSNFAENRRLPIVLNFIRPIIRRLFQTLKKAFHQFAELVETNPFMHYTLQFDQ